MRQRTSTHDIYAMYYNEFYNIRHWQKIRLLNTYKFTTQQIA